MSLEWENEMKDAGEEAEEESKKWKERKKWHSDKGGVEGNKRGLKFKKRLREEPLGMSTQQKCECLASVVGTQFKRVCCLKRLTATQIFLNHKPKVGKEKKTKKCACIMGKDCRKVQITWTWITVSKIFNGDSDIFLFPKEHSNLYKPFFSLKSNR